MNVLYDNQVFATQEYGGVSRVFYELIKNLLSREQLNIFLFHGLYINRFPLSDFKDQFAYYSGRKIHRFPYTKKIIRVLNTLYFQYFSPTKKIDLFHPTDFSPPVYRWKASPLVLTIYDLIPELFPHYFKDIDVRLKIKKKSIKRADKIITISQCTKKDLVNYYGLPADKIHVIYPGVRRREAPGMCHVNPLMCKGKPKTWRLDPIAWQGDNSSPLDKPFILYVGVRKGYKNFAALLDVFAHHPTINHEYNLFCFGGNPFTPSEEETMSKLGCRDRIIHIWGDDQFLIELYKKASVFVYPSLYEGFGLPPLEAMAYNCPVIAADTASIPEVLADAAVYFDPRDTGSLYQAMETLLRSPSRAQEMIKKGRRQTCKYSWEQMAEQTYDVYQKFALK